MSVVSVAGGGSSSGAAAVLPTIEALKVHPEASVAPDAQGVFGFVPDAISLAPALSLHGGGIITLYSLAYLGSKDHLFRDCAAPGRALASRELLSELLGLDPDINLWVESGSADLTATRRLRFERILLALHDIGVEVAALNRTAAHAPSARLPPLPEQVTALTPFGPSSLSPSSGFPLTTSDLSHF
jgi:hypothetical protein